jgi:acetolactate synthase-1/2/3 large subunit
VSEANISCGELLVRYLEQYGIDTVFGIPGNHTVQLYRGLAGSSLRHISPRHEQGAAFMADGYARACGKPAACFLISGPGLGNAITPMMQALADSIPMLVISSVAARHQLAMGEGHLHEMPDQRALAAQCSRFSHTLMRPDELPKVLARAFAVFDSARPGPVHIQLPLDVITAPVPDVQAVPWTRVAAPCASSAGLAQLAARLSDADRPCLLFGGGAVRAAAQARALAERLDAPVVCTVNAKGILPPGHALQVGGSPSAQSVRDLIKESDCVLAVGTELAETDYNMLFLGDMPKPAWLARIDIDPAQLCRNINADLPLCGDARESLRALNKALGPDVPHLSTGAASRVVTVRERMREERHFHADIDAFFATLQTALPDLVLVGDSTLPTYYAVWQYESAAPRRYFHSATGAGTLGYAIPAAIGASRACPGQTVAALIGDGAAQFTLMELAAAVQEQLPIIVLLWNNNGYGEIRAGMEAEEIVPVGVQVDAPDFVAAARALGCQAQRATTLDELAAALGTAAGTGKTTLIELRQEDFLSSPAGGWYVEGLLRPREEPPQKD